jgi:hypothetical protein
MEEEGLFRISASLGEISRIKQEANKGIPLILSLELKCLICYVGKEVVFQNPHLAAAVLKTFFR